LDGLHDAIRVTFSGAKRRIVADVDYDELVLGFRIADKRDLPCFMRAEM
jgi:hypothetical protein